MAEQQKPPLVLERRLEAPVEKVFKAWTDGQALKHWFGPGGETTVAAADLDVTVGGRYRIVLEKPGGERHCVGGIYREIVPNAKLVFTWAWESTPERESLVTVRLEAADGGTNLTLVHEQLADEATRDRHQHGWSRSLDRLLNHVA